MFSINGVKPKILNGGDVLEDRNSMGGSNLWLFEGNFESLLRIGSYSVFTCG